jgi:hypothetical protein
MMITTEDNRRSQVLAEEARLTWGSWSTCWEPTVINYRSTTSVEMYSCLYVLRNNKNNRKVSDFQDACCLNNVLQNYHTLKDVLSDVSGKHTACCFHFQSV